MKVKLLNQDELERERTAIPRKSETLISQGFFIMVNCYLSFLLTIYLSTRLSFFLLVARSAEMFLNFNNTECKWLCKTTRIETKYVLRYLKSGKIFISIPPNDLNVSLNENKWSQRYINTFLIESVRCKSSKLISIEFPPFIHNSFLSNE